MKVVRRRLPGARAGGLITAVALIVVPACTSSATVAPNAPVLTVVTALYPLAQAAQQIGQPEVSVTNVVPDGANPRRYTLTAAQVGEVRKADLALEVGDGFQPSFESAAAGAARVAKVSRYVWLDPAAMKQAVGSIAAAMEAADPPAAQVFRQGATDFAAEVSSDGIDYESTLSTCPRTTIFTPDGAFASATSIAGLTNVVVGTSPLSPGRVAALAKEVGRTGGKVFSETWVPDTAIRQVATAAGVKVSALDTLLGPPPHGWPDARYIDLLESNLSALSSALGCSTDQ